VEAGLELCDFGLQMLRLSSVEQHCEFVVALNMGYRIWEMRSIMGKRRSKGVKKFKKPESADKAVLAVIRRSAEAKWRVGDGREAPGGFSISPGHIPLIIALTHPTPAIQAD
jgi:hypothetical protein